MKQFFLSTFIFLSGFLFSQNQRFYYDYQFQTDSTDVDTRKSELMVLDIDKIGSKYYSDYVYQNDSIMDAQFKKNTSAHNDDPVAMSGKEGIVMYKLLKAYPEFRINHIVSLDMNLYSADQQVKLNWKILSDKDKIGNWQVQKAETDFAGRHWIAWFSTEIPIQDGPYKFHGLPGLIVKIEDRSGFHKMELKGIRKNTSVRDILAFKFEKAIPVSYKKYQTIYKNYRKDPLANFRKAALSGQTYMIDDSGKEIKGQDYVKIQEKVIQERMKKNNNILELDLLK